MPFYRNTVYPYLVDKLGDPPPIKRIREQIVPRAEGIVLEIGSGSGANFPHYDPANVSKLYALEPNSGMIRLAQRQQRRTELRIQYLTLRGEEIPLEEASIDTVVSTFTLCTIRGVEEAIQGLKRVLKPQGKLIFFELGLAPDPEVQIWQRRLEPLYSWLFQGLYLTRDIPSIIRGAGFQIDQMEQGYMAKFPKSSSYCWWGIARSTQTSPRSIVPSIIRAL